MRVVRADQIGGPEVMHLDDVATPEPGPGEVRVAIEVAGVNFVDIYYRTGLYPSPLPLLLGQEAVGAVEAVGPGVTETQVGDRVAWLAHLGSYATHAVVPAAKLVPVPDGMDARDAAAAMVQGLTAHYLIHSTYPLQEGDTCLVHAAAGGVGLLLCQIAKLRGARVIATTSTEEKAQLAREAGADEVILYTREDFAAATRRLTGGEGVAVVYDGVGKGTFIGSLDALRIRGYLVLFGTASGPVPPLEPQILNAKGGLYLTRPSIGHYTRTREELLERAHEVFNWIEAGRLRLRIGHTYCLADAAEAHRALAGRETTGKLLLIP